MIPGSLNTAIMGGGKNSFVENWNNLDDWDLNAVSISSSYSSTGTAAASSNRVIVSSYGGTGNQGPVLSYDLGGGIGDFRLEFDAEVVNTSNSDRNFIQVGLGDSGQALLEDGVRLLILDTTQTNTLSRVVVISYSAGASTTHLDTSTTTPGTYTYTFVFERVGSTVTWDLTGDFTNSGSFTYTGSPDTLFVALFRGDTPATIMPQSVGPLTLEY